LIKAIIFDIDGTLVDSVDLHAQAWQEALREFGHDVPFANVRQQIGKGGDQLIPVFLSKHEQLQHGLELEEYRAKLWKTQYLPKVRPFPAVREFVKRILDDGKQVALASSAKEEELEKYKRIAHIDDLVRKEASSDDAEKSKPHPDIFEAALAKLHGVGPSEAIVIGDSPYDAQASGQIGIRSLAVLSGGFPEEQLRAAGYIAIYKDCADILAHYAESPLAQRVAA
jgi:HAD superfamily hydrolase (TIGR01509 family)